MKVAEKAVWSTEELAKKYRISGMRARRLLDLLPNIPRIGIHRVLVNDRIPEFEELLRRRGLLSAEPTPAA